MKFDEIDEAIYLKFNNSYIPILPDLLTTFIFSNQSYYSLFMDEKIKKNDLLKYIIREFDTNNNTSYAYIVRLSLQFVKQTIHFEKIDNIQQSIFSDGSIIC